MTVRLHETAAHEMLTGLLRRLNAGTRPGAIEIYGGEIGDDGAVLAVIELERPAGAVEGNVLALTPPATLTLARRDGRATWARLRDGAGKPLVDVDAGEDGATILLNDADFVKDGPIAVRRFDLVLPVKKSERAVRA